MHTQLLRFTFAVGLATLTACAPTLVPTDGSIDAVGSDGITTDGQSSNTDSAMPPTDGSGMDAHMDAPVDVVVDSGDPLTAACTMFASAQCREFDLCTNHVSPFVRALGGVQACIDRNVAACIVSAHAMGSTTTATTLAHCATAISAQSCTDFLTGVPIAACNPPGTLPLGANCYENSQCQTGTCTIARLSNCGTCAALAALGENCSQVLCNRGLFCNFNAQPPVCAPYVGLNAVCDNSRLCSVGLVCFNPQAAPTGTCRALGSSVGASCDPAGSFAPQCDRNRGLYCTASDTCAQEPTAAAGMPCNVGSPPAVCDVGLVCAVGGIERLACAPLVADGQLCDTSGAPCTPPAKCIPSSAGSVSGVCQLPASDSCN